MKHDDVKDLLRKHNACDEAKRWVGKRDMTSRKLWAECENASWMLWLAARLGVDRKTIVRVACSVAREALKYVPAYVPAGEDRPRICIETTERWTRGEATIDEVRQAKYSARSDAYAAAAYAADAAAFAAAYAARARNRVLSDFAERVVHILVDMGAPGAQWLDLSPLREGA